MSFCDVFRAVAFSLWITPGLRCWTESPITTGMVGTASRRRGIGRAAVLMTVFLRCWVSPLDTEAGRNSAVAEFLASRGRSLFGGGSSGRHRDAEEVAARYGALTRFRQHRTGDGFELDESEMMVAGLPITLLATDLP